MSVKEMLYETIQDLNDEQARQVLTVALRVKKQKAMNSTWERLSKTPGIKLPARRKRRIRDFQPVKGWGIPASQLLIEDRR
jgi:hypothetical protein